MESLPLSLQRYLALPGPSIGSRGAVTFGAGLPLSSGTSSLMSGPGYCPSWSNVETTKEESMKYIGKFLNMPYINVYEIATFYSMYNLAPVGKYFVQVCTTSPCALRGANKLVDICKEKISKNQNELSQNGLCSWTEVECLGACINAPMMQVNEDYYEDLDETNTKKILNSFLEDKPLKPGSYRNRKNSAPEKNQILTNGHKNA